MTDLPSYHRRILTFPAVQPCPSSSPATLLRSLAADISALRSHLFPVLRRGVREAFREVAIIIAFLDDVSDRRPHLPESMAVSLSDLHVALQKLQRRRRRTRPLDGLMGFLIYCRAILFETDANPRKQCRRFREIDGSSFLNPESLTCPISLELMTDPVTISTGQTYDRSSIEIVELSGGGGSSKSLRGVGIRVRVRVGVGLGYDLESIERGAVLCCNSLRRREREREKGLFSLDQRGRRGGGEPLSDVGIDLNT